MQPTGANHPAPSLLRRGGAACTHCLPETPQQPWAHFPLQATTWPVEARDSNLEHWDQTSSWRPSPPPDPSTRNPLIPEIRLVAGPPTSPDRGCSQKSAVSRLRAGAGKGGQPGGQASPHQRGAEDRPRGESSPDGERLPVPWRKPRSTCTDVQERPNQGMALPQVQPPGSTPCPLQHRP